MSITRQETLIHWNYFLSIEEDLQRLSRFVDFSEKNDSTFSLEIARILMASTAEVDVVLKKLCSAINPNSDAKSINQYYNPITNLTSDFKDFRVIIPTEKMELKPWSAWDANHPPLWWTANNKVKHERHEHFQEASLKNCLNAVSGLYVAVLHLYSDQANKGELLTLPKLFNVSDEHFGGTSMGRYGTGFKYRIMSQ